MTDFDGDSQNSSSVGSQADSRGGLKDPSPSASTKKALSSSSILQLLRKRHIGVPLVGLLILITIAMFMMSKEPVTLPNASSEPDPMAQDRPSIAGFSVKSAEGATFELSAHKGQVIIVSFWASDCTTCVLELPAFSELLKRYKNEGLTVLSINLDADAAAAAKSAKELWSRGKFDFEAYLDPTHAVAKTFEIETVPSGFVIDRNGRLAFNSYGANDWLAPETARLIEDLLMER